MARLPEKVRKQRERQLAKYIAQMKCGAFDWGDDKPHIDKDGQYEVNWFEAIRRAGWNTENTSVVRRLKDSEEIHKLIDLEEIRMKKTALVHMRDIKSDVGQLRTAAANELMARFEADPGQFTARDLIAVFTAMEAVERRDKMIDEGKFVPGTTVNIANLHMGLQNNLPEAQFKELLQQSAEEKRKQAEMMESMMNAVSAKEVLEGELLEEVLEEGE